MRSELVDYLLSVQKQRLEWEKLAGWFISGKNGFLYSEKNDVSVYKQTITSALSLLL